MDDFYERRNIPLIGLDHEYEIDRKGRVWRFKSTAAGDSWSPLKPTPHFQYGLRFNNKSELLQVNYLLDKAFPEHIMYTRVLMRQPDEWCVFIAVGSMGERGSWRIDKHEGVPLRNVKKHMLPESAVRLAVEQGWGSHFPEADRKTISGDEYVKLKHSGDSVPFDSPPETEGQADRLQQFADDMRMGTNHLRASFGNHKQEEPPSEQEESPERPWNADPLVVMAESMASLARSMEMLIKGRQEKEDG